jgi:hypothetical protein
MEMEEDAEIIALLLKDLPSCTFEPIDLTPDSIMQWAGVTVPMLYDSASNPRLPCLYICPVATGNVLGRAPLIPCFIGGNSHPTIPYHLKDDRRIVHASADTQRDRGNLNGSRLYKVNIWMWRYSRGRPRMVSITEAERIRAAPAERLSESRIRAAKARKRRSEAADAAAGAAD